MEDTIRRIIPEELDYLQKYDRLAQLINARVSLPDHQVDLLIKLLHQNSGTLSKKKRDRFFPALEDQEAGVIEMFFGEG